MAQIRQYTPWRYGLAAFGTAFGLEAVLGLAVLPVLAPAATGMAALTPQLNAAMPGMVPMEAGLAYWGVQGAHVLALAGLGSYVTRPSGASTAGFIIGALLPAGLPLLLVGHLGLPWVPPVAAWWLPALAGSLCATVLMWAREARTTLYR